MTDAVVSEFCENTGPKSDDREIKIHVIDFKIRVAFDSDFTYTIFILK